jgi:hypothetical protein
MGNGGDFPEGKATAGHSCPSSAELKNGGDIPPLPIRLNGIVLNSLSSGTILLFTLSNT